jgi:putative transposase
LRLSRKVELQPTPTQIRAFLQHSGNTRWAWNWGLARKNEAWEERKVALESGIHASVAPKLPSAIDLHRELNALKKLPPESGGIPWMYEASKWAPQNALRDLDIAFQCFFLRVKRGEKPGYPRFKKKSSGIGGFRLCEPIVVTKKSIQLPRIGRVRIKPGDHGYIPLGRYSQASITERAGRWFVSIVVPEIEEAVPNGGPSIGLDLGVTQLATLSDGTFVENPKALAAGQSKIAQLQRALQRKQKGSANQVKARAKLARAHYRVANVRRDAIHKATTSLTKSHGRIVIEDLKVANMTRKGGARKRGLNRVVRDAGFSEFRRQLEYKGKLHGCEIVVVPPHYTSQRCSVCGHTEAGNRPSQAKFLCQSCGHAENADVNAAKNLMMAGSCPDIENACGAGVRRASRPQSALKQESAWS